MHPALRLLAADDGAVVVDDVGVDGADGDAEGDVGVDGRESGDGRSSGGRERRGRRRSGIRMALNASGAYVSVLDGSDGMSGE